MTDSDGSVAGGAWRHWVRLGVFAVFLLGMFYLVAIARVIDVGRIREMVGETGPIAPVVYGVVAAGLGAVFVPGPILAAGSGILFGAFVGTFVTLGATVGTAATAAFLGSRAGRGSVRGVLGEERAERIDAQVQKYGLWAVVGQRFVPGISDAMAAYAFGAFGIPVWQMAVGAFIGSAPRAFVYTALGASIGELNAGLAYAAIAVWCVTAVLGAIVAHRGYRSWREQRGDRSIGSEPDVR
ncbi:TVP38/TMEM64 family protein [Nocardia huaxiensis]|uniref:TVP38/TMEM64 family membrane protein n=1 Tax=Nocardia huaxiensis TaxID=2755382 RepID=A0A7D6Z163_9NOCA|nr:VTT domain-containing protein [Nocardia huaxiensis]QLY29946.1 TVP38/TMEM64 family protein [Nocardia huaxiensis]